MANIAGTYNLTSYHPNVRWVIGYTQIGRTSTTATYRFDVSMTLLTGQSYGYGYDVYLYLTQNGPSKVSGHQLKTSSAGGTSWSTSFNVTLSTDAAGGWIGGIRLYSASNTDTTHYQQKIDVSGEVSKNSYGTVPATPSWISANGVYEPGENVSVSWGASSGASSYEVQYNQYDSVSGWGDWGNTAESPNGTNLSHHIYSVGANRVKLKYRVRAKNYVGASGWSNESNEIYRSGLMVYSGGFKRGRVRVWNGNSWVNGRVKVWNGSSWVNGK